jgi:hypothetical protein
MDIDTMLAGPEMDARVIEKAMGWRMAWEDRLGSYWTDQQGIHGRAIGGHDDPWSPSTNIAHAMEAAGKRRFIFWNLEDGRVCATFDIDPMDYISQHTIDVGLPSGVGVADTLPLAICRAVLNAVRKDVITYRGASITPDKMTGANGP